MMTRMRDGHQDCGILVIGNEVLSGKVTDANSTYLIAELTELGVPVRRVAIVPDEVAVIADHVRAFAGLFDHVFTTGGVGPTHDDVTMAAVARAFDRPLVADAGLEGVIRAFFKERCNATWLRMARVPEGTVLVEAPGMPFPVTRVENVWIFPGEPNVLRAKFGAIRETFRQDAEVCRRLFTTLDEGDLADILSRLESEEGVRVGSYPTYEPRADHNVMITVESRDRDRVDAAMRALRAAIPADSIVRET